MSGSSRMLYHNKQGAVTKLIKYCVSITPSAEGFYVDLKL